MEESSRGQYGRNWSYGGNGCSDIGTCGSVYKWANICRLKRTEQIVGKESFWIDITKVAIFWIGEMDCMINFFSTFKLGIEIRFGQLLSLPQLTG